MNVFFVSCILIFRLKRMNVNVFVKPRRLLAGRLVKRNWQMRNLYLDCSRAWVLTILMKRENCARSCSKRGLVANLKLVRKIKRTISSRAHRSFKKCKLVAMREVVGKDLRKCRNTDHWLPKYLTKSNYKLHRI